MPFPSLPAWPGVEPVRALTGGARNEVWEARRGDLRLVVRRSGRSPDSLDWELDLLAHLAGHGVGVPVTVPAADGRRHVDGVVVQEYVAGRPPAGAADWRRVVETLVAVHRLTGDRPQRPGFASAADLLAADQGGDVRLDRMPPDDAAAVRAAWQPVAHAGARCAIHGDLGAGNILVTDDRVVLLDWDEARVDVPWFDFAFVPDDVPVPSPVERKALATAGVAWEAATCWVAEPEYAARRLAELVRIIDAA